MKKSFKFMLCVAAVLLCISIPVMAMAAEVNVATSEEFSSAVENCTDSELTINLAADLTNLNFVFTDEYTPSSVVINGNGHTVDEIKATGNVTVTFNGNIVTEDPMASVVTGGNATVTVNGNITSENYGITADENSYVIVTGNITASYDNAIYTDEHAIVSVTGDVRSLYTVTVYTSGYSNVQIEGNVYGGDGYKEGVDFSDPEDYSDGYEGIVASNYSEVYVKGNVYGGKGYGTYSYGGSGVNAIDNSYVTVEGNVFGGDTEADPSVVPDKDYESYAGAGILMSSSSTVAVDGNVTGGNTNANSGYAGDGVNIMLKIVEAPRLFTPEFDPAKGTLVVTGIIKGGEGATNGSPVYISSEELEYVTFIDPADAEELTQQDLDTLIEAVIGNFIDTLGNFGVSISDFEDDFYDGITEEVLNATGINLDEVSEEDLENLSDEQFKNFVNAFVTAGNNGLGNAILKVSNMNGIIVYGMESVADGEPFVILNGKTSPFGNSVLNNIDFIVLADEPTNGDYELEVEGQQKDLLNLGDVLVITPTPDEGFVVKNVTVNGNPLAADEDGAYRYTVTEEGLLSVVVEFKEKPATPPTGDITNMNLWVITMLIGAAGMLVALKSRKSA